MSNFENNIHEINKKMKHMVIFQNELAANSMPAVSSSHYKNDDEFKQSTIKHEQLMRQGKVVSNYILNSSDTTDNRPSPRSKS